MSFGDCYRLETALIYGMFILGNLLSSPRAVLEEKPSCVSVQDAAPIWPFPPSFSLLKFRWGGSIQIFGLTGAGGVELSSESFGRGSFAEKVVPTSAFFSPASLRLFLWAFSTQEALLTSVCVTSPPFQAPRIRAPADYLGTAIPSPVVLP